MNPIVFFRWLCSVRRNYRSVTYHNWRHAFNVCQLMFSIITNTTWWKQLGEIECLALVIACLCHDLDHRGDIEIKRNWINMFGHYDCSQLDKKYVDIPIVLHTRWPRKPLSQTNIFYGTSCMQRIIACSQLIIRLVGTIFRV